MNTTETTSAFLNDIEAIRRRAREHMDEGALTASYQGNVGAVLKLLDDALATELVCMLRYRRHYFCAEGIGAESVKAEFLEHANEEQLHADQIATRIVQLGGRPNFSPEGMLSRSHSQYDDKESLMEMIKEDLIAERVAIDIYRAMIEYVSAFDSTTRRLLEEILAKEEQHADDLREFLAGYSAKP